MFVSKVFAEVSAEVSTESKYSIVCLVVYLFYAWKMKNKIRIVYSPAETSAETLAKTSAETSVKYSRNNHKETQKERSVDGCMFGLNDPNREYCISFCPILSK